MTKPGKQPRRTAPMELVTTGAAKHRCMSLPSSSGKRRSLGHTLTGKDCADDLFGPKRPDTAVLKLRISLRPCRPRPYVATSGYPLIPSGVAPTSLAIRGPVSPRMPPCSGPSRTGLWRACRASLTAPARDSVFCCGQDIGKPSGNVNIVNGASSCDLSWLSDAWQLPFVDPFCSPSSTVERVGSREI